MAFEIYAIRYATFANTAHQNFLVRDMHDAPMPIDYYIWLIRQGKNAVLVDTGFNMESGARHGRQLLADPVAALSSLDVDPASIKDVVITHLHYDHAGNLDRFPNARFHIQDAEVAFATGRCMCNALLRRPYDFEDIIQFIRHVYAGRVVFHRGEAALTDGITLHPIPGHTAGLQAVRIRTDRGDVVLASDALHFYANAERENPFPILLDVADVLAGQARVQQLAESPDHVIPGHDPLVAQRYRSLDIMKAEIYCLHEPPRR